jgi:hypothetical protein
MTDVVVPVLGEESALYVSEDGITYTEVNGVATGDSSLKAEIRKLTHWQQAGKLPVVGAKEVTVNLTLTEILADAGQAILRETAYSADDVVLYYKYYDFKAALDEDSYYDSGTMRVSEWSRSGPSNQERTIRCVLEVVGIPTWNEPT